MRHASIPAGIGLVVGLADVVAYYIIGGAKLGPAWFAISIALEAIPLRLAPVFVALSIVTKTRVIRSFQPERGAAYRGSNDETRKAILCATFWQSVLFARSARLRR
ncbi:MAG: hypothetical protein QOC72_786 [Methylobacteriaceae bacterium]|jgi:hypothetical protein|nr:hypothetical protein [Methylobacteriaceae bacterium]